MNDLLNSFFNFVSLSEALKKIERFKDQVYWIDYPKLKRYESVADHSWRLALLVILVEDRLSKSINLQKALNFAILHDLAEAVAGDSHPMGKDGTGKSTYYSIKNLSKKKFDKENKAIKEMLNILPKSENEKMYKLWLEYEKRESFESKIVKALDAIECMLQVYEYRKSKMFKNHLDFTIEYGTRNSSSIHL